MTCGALCKVRRNARPAVYFIKYTFVKTSNQKQNDRVYTMHLYVQISVQMLCRILIFED